MIDPDVDARCRRLAINDVLIARASVLAIADPSARRWLKSPGKDTPMSEELRTAER